MGMPDAIDKVLGKLEDASEEGRVNWHRGTGARHEMLVVFEQASIRLFQYIDHGRSESGYTIQILDGNGDVAERYSSPIASPAGKRLEALYRQAERKTRRTDEVINRVLRELNRKGMIGCEPF
jgi:hypothetical protein